MASFQPKKVIKKQKLYLKKKLEEVTEQTEHVTSILNSCVSEFKTRVDEILEIKDEKYLSVYRKLKEDLDHFNEKVFILKASLEEGSDSEDENSEGIQSTDAEDSEIRPSTRQSNSDPSSNSSKNVSSNALPCPPIETNEETKPKELYENENKSLAENNLYSVPSDNNVPNVSESASLLEAKDSEHGNISEAICDRCESTQSISQSSCYRSFSSNISEYSSNNFPNSSLASGGEIKSSHNSQSNQLDAEPESVLQSLPDILIQPPVIKIPSTVSGTLSHIVNPENFWIQIENSCSAGISFPKSEYSPRSCITSIKENHYCLAPFKSSPFYYRAQSLSNAEQEDEFVKVHFIDHGSTQDVILHDLRDLPSSAYHYPAQAIHCHLYGIAPVDGSWSEKCIERFKEFRNLCNEAKIKSKERSYGVQLPVQTFEDLDEDYSSDVAELLSLEGLAISEAEPDQQISNYNTRSENSCSNPAYNDSLAKVSTACDITAISNDSGVSVTSAYKSSQKCAGKPKDLDQTSGDYFAAVSTHLPSNSCDENLNINYDYNAQNLISFDSSDMLLLQHSSAALKSSDAAKNLCLICKADNFCLHLKLPLPSLVYVEKNMAIVMLSHIISPHEFYVNNANKNSANLDELRELMTYTYGSQKSSLPQINPDDLSENMFCAGLYDADNSWYRVKIVRINSQDRTNKEALVQYVDYGNTAIIKCADLLPLNSQFAQHAIFAIKCSLAGVQPIEEVSPGSVSKWNENAVNAFKELTSFDRYLTAQICNEMCNSCDMYHVLLWDTEGTSDLLINSALADLGVVKLDENLLLASLSDEASKPCDNLDILNEWDPMNEEFSDVQNSYGVDDDDIQIATSGYRAKDDEYICKYFSLRGKCPRGANCRFMHLPLLKDGVTRDQEEVYCLDSVPLIPEDVTNIIVQVSFVINPSHFYIVLPYGCKSVDEIDKLVKAGSSLEDIMNNEAQDLFYAIDKTYSSAPFQENTAIALAIGTLVVAKRKWDKKFHRGRVVDVADISAPSKIYFVDSGDTEWVPRKFIRTIQPKFLYTPFQAVQCSLHGVKPLESENKWSFNSVTYFKNLVEGAFLLAEIVHRLDKVIHVNLRKTNENDHRKIDELLVSEGFATLCTDVSATNKELPAAKKEYHKRRILVPG